MTGSPCRRFPSDTLAAAVRGALVAEGVPDAIAAVEAEVMVDADLCGVPSHGILMLPRLLAALRDGRATARPRLLVAREHGATCVLDGDHGPGRYVARAAMDHAVARARAHGVGVCLAVHTTHWGRAHAYACRAARAGAIGICTTNAIPTMGWPGLTRPLLGNNPLAIAVPRGPGRDPLVLDIAMTQAAMGTVATHRREGRGVPPGWGLDASGRPAEDAASILASGLLAPMGGHKGLGLAIVMELLTAGLAGGKFGHEIAVGDQSGADPDASKLFVALEVGAFGDPDVFARRVEDLAAHLQAAGGEPRLPGERGWETRDRYLREGIPVHPDIEAQLAKAGVRLGTEDSGLGTRD
jgi:LDH2 family malate/lactate/ureidoglycolate dehydrogenase